MYWIIILSILLLINAILLKFSCNNCSQSTCKKPKFNMPEKNEYISQPVMADK
ncbi:hypothetical protein ACSSV5_001807 [Psychroflexus sp. MBR-150]|jgi:hypothetical protein